MMKYVPTTEDIDALVEGGIHRARLPKGCPPPAPASPGASKGKTPKKAMSVARGSTPPVSPSPSPDQPMPIGVLFVAVVFFIILVLIRLIGGK